MDNNNNQHAVTRIETFGVEQIPDHERNATPVDLLRMVFGGASTSVTAVLGSLPVLLGLSFQAGLWVILLGVTLDALILAPMGLFGPPSGTSNTVSSGVYFGVHGRIVGSFLSLLTAIAFFSLSAWSSGDALVGGTRRLVGLEESELNLSLAYGLFAVLMLTVCICDFRFMLLVNRVVVWAASLLFLLGLFAFTGPFDAAYAGSVQFGQPGSWAAFIGAILLTMNNPISFGTFLGDWARYIPRQTSQARTMLVVIGAQLATLVSFLFGLATATIVAVRAPDYITANNYVGGLPAIAPDWSFLPVCLIAVIGGMSIGTTSLYGIGLDMSSVFPRLLSQVQATVLIGVASIGFIFVGRFAFNLVQSVFTFATLIVTCTTPWMVIMLIGLLTRRGFYRSNDLQVFTRGQRDGAYQFEHGWNWRGVGVWISSAAAGLAFVNLPGQFVGPLGELVGGIDLSLPVAPGLAAPLYLALLCLFPEPPCVYDPQGPHWVRAHGMRRAPAIATV